MVGKGGERDGDGDGFIYSTRTYYDQQREEGDETNRPRSRHCTHAGISYMTDQRMLPFRCVVFGQSGHLMKEAKEQMVNKRIIFRFVISGVEHVSKFEEIELWLNYQVANINVRHS